MISEDELAAVVIALQTLRAQDEPALAAAPSKWKLAARQPDLELEELRAL